MIRLLRPLTLLLFLVLPGIAAAHVANESYLTLQIRAAQLDGDWKIKLSDLGRALPLDADHDGEYSAAEIESARGDIERYLASQLLLRGNGVELGLRFERLLFGSQNGEDYVVSRLHANAGEEIHRLDVDYRLFTTLDSTHSSHLRIVWPGDRISTAVVAAGSGVLAFDEDQASSGGLLEFLLQGVWHIWIGYDHILFLIVLLIPAVFERSGRGRRPALHFRDALGRVVAIVSAFTVAHSITLTCAVMQWIVLPGKLVETSIAASVALAALHNFLPRTAGGRGAWLAFGFGLLHGFGFAGALGELELGAGPLWRTLLGFNLGVELGQLAIVAVFLPVAFLLRETRFYRIAVLYIGSAMACLCAAIWFVQRALA
jgi:hypothetical protein